MLLLRRNGTVSTRGALISIRSDSPKPASALGRAGVAHLITFRQQFWDTVDVTPASVVILFVTNPTSHIGNYKLCGQLTRELRQGSRIVAYRLSLGDWQAVEVASVPGDSQDKRGSEVKLWVADGTVHQCLE